MLDGLDKINIPIAVQLFGAKPKVMADAAYKLVHDYNVKIIDINMGCPVEFVEGKYHKRGALAAARDNNPEKKSSGCQFYIVQGKVYSNKDLDHIEEQHNASVKQQMLNNWLKSDASKADQEALTKLQRARNFAAFNHYCDSLVEHLVETNPDAKLFKFSPEQRKAYTTDGGAPFLDGDYTVFGEVINGLNVIDSIAAVETDRNDRPLDDIIMKIKIVKK